MTCKPPMTLLAAALLLSALSACKAPPPAPEGINDASRYLIREFYADDAIFQAGVQGYLEWYEDEGKDLVNLENTLDTVNEFQLDDLRATDIELLPITHGLDPTLSAGVVSLALMNCPIRESEALLLRRDQHELFDDWEDYERTFLTDRAAYVAGWEDGFDRIDDALDPFADGFDGSPYAGTLLQSTNIVNPSPVTLVGDFDAYPMQLDFRHGVFQVNEEQVEVFAILTFITESVSGPEGNNHLNQSYSVELNAVRGEQTLRTLAVWIEGGSDTANIATDDPLVLNSALRKSRLASERMTEICEGIYEVPDEPN